MESTKRKGAILANSTELADRAGNRLRHMPRSGPGGGSYDALAREVNAGDVFTPYTTNGDIEQAYDRYRFDVAPEKYTRVVTAGELAVGLAERAKDVAIVKQWADKRVELAKQMTGPLSFARAVLLDDEGKLNPNEYELGLDDVHSMEDLMPAGNTFRAVRTLRKKARKDRDAIKEQAATIEGHIRSEYRSNMPALMQLAKEDALGEGYDIKFPDQDPESYMREPEE